MPDAPRRCHAGDTVSNATHCIPWNAECSICNPTIGRTIQTEGSERLDGVLPCRADDHVWGVVGEWDDPAPDQRCRCGAHIYRAPMPDDSTGTHSDHCACDECWPRPEHLPAPPAPRREDAAGERVAQIAARLNAATPGPWEWRGKRLNGGPANAVGVVSHGAAWDVSKPDAEFIAHSRSDMEYLLAALSTAERERDELEREYRELCLVLRTAVERHNLGLGGERLEALLIQALDERTAALRHILRVYELPDVGPLEDAVERARASLARVPSGGET